MLQTASKAPPSLRMLYSFVPAHGCICSKPIRRGLALKTSPAIRLSGRLGAQMSQDRQAPACRFCVCARNASCGHTTSNVPFAQGIACASVFSSVAYPYSLPQCRGSHASSDGKPFLSVPTKKWILRGWRSFLVRPQFNVIQAPDSLADRRFYFALAAARHSLPDFFLQLSQLLAFCDVHSLVLPASVDHNLSFVFSSSRA